MDSLSFPDDIPPPNPIKREKVSNNLNELISVIWEAAESLASPDLLVRASGFDRLVEFDAIRQLPLVVYLLVTRLAEPDIELRTRIVKYLGSLVSAGQSPHGSSEEVYQILTTSLSEMRTREVFALLQVTEYDTSAEGYIADLLSLCSFAGGHLSQILSNRSNPVEIRRQSAFFIGLLGYLEALPVLERMASRLESRGDGEDNSILPVLQNAVQLLTAP